jgi:hypothetical protein
MPAWHSSANSTSSQRKCCLKSIKNELPQGLLQLLLLILLLAANGTNTIHAMHSRMH